MERFDVGAVVKLDRGVGVVTVPISDQAAGHVLTMRDGHLVGMPVDLGDIMGADEASEGFAQLAYQMIRLGSAVIEQRLLVYRR
jgi:hypothetical protein